MATTFEVLSLGTGPLIDTVEGNVLSENAGALVGMTFGSAASPLGFGAQKTFSPVDYSGGTANMYDIDNTVSNDTFSIDGGPAQTFDGLAVYEAMLHYTDGTPPVKITAVVIQDTAGNLYLAPESSANADYTAMTAAPIESLTLGAVYPISSGRLLADRQYTDFLCYAAGSMIATDRGPKSVERLKIGDQVVTLDNGPQPIIWLRRAEQPLEALEERRKPVLIQAGAFGPGQPSRDLVVSPQHRVLVGGQGQLAALDTGEAFAPAKALTCLPGVRHLAGRRRITWLHFACAGHEVVRANGCWSESLLLGPMALRGMTARESLVLGAVFGGDTTAGALNGPPARPCLPAAEARRLIAEHAGVVRRAA
ncbi:MAG: Hint domain-containing protein [Rhodobacter sp.]|nr:Hint domain-containing protein [Rhodobacter sp.]